MFRRLLILNYVLTAGFAAACTGAAAAQDLTVFERVLVPISVHDVAGAFGSRWSTELWYRNNGTVPVAIFPVAVSHFVPAVGRTVSLQVIGSFPAERPGQIVFMSRAGSDEIQFDLRLFNKADPRVSWGTKLPVVREREFANSILLINIPTAADFRAALRIYGMPDNSSRRATVHLEMYSNDERLLVSQEMTLEGWPLYGQILSLTDTFPEIRQVERVRVKIDSRDAQVRVWAFIAVVQTQRNRWHWSHRTDRATKHDRS